VSAGVTVNVAEISIYLDTQMDLTPGSTLQIVDFQVFSMSRIKENVAHEF
jgi:hypothetical protein